MTPEQGALKEISYSKNVGKVRFECFETNLIFNDLTFYYSEKTSYKEV